jgi:hypothetical protein
MSITRRQFFERTAMGSLAFGSLRVAGSTLAAEAPSLDHRTYLSRILYTQQEIDDWFAAKAFEFEKYDGELGWVLRDIRLADGVDGSTSTYRYGQNGERRMINYADRSCQINTYGDSFTQCHQVSDGETWQEVLAAHLGEPIRNFGVGGYSVYQAYRRMLRQEAALPSKTIVFNIYSDDHYRNLTGWRQIRRGRKTVGKYMLPTLPHLRVNLSTGECQERENACPTRESFYRMSELDWVLQRFREDFVLGIRVAQENARQGNHDIAWQTLRELGNRYGFTVTDEGHADPSQYAQDLFTQAALLATKTVVDRIVEFARKNERNVLFVLSFSSGHVARHLRGEPRFDQPLIDFLNEKELPYVDLLSAHQADFEQFALDVPAYVKRYYIGHYSPAGNFFQAFAMKDKLVEMLDPKPPAYSPP